MNKWLAPEQSINLAYRISPATNATTEFAGCNSGEC